MNNNKIEELKAAVLAKQEANKVKIAEAAEIASLQATLRLEESESLVEAKVKLAAREANTKKLSALIEECSAIIDATPVTNKHTRAVRVWGGRRRFAFGTQINLMYQLATGIMFTCNDHKDLLLAHVGIDMGLLESMVEAFGTPTYYSVKDNCIVDTKIYNVESALDAIAVMQSELGVVVDTSLINEKVFSEELAVAVKLANDNKLAADIAIEEADLQL